MEEHEEEGAAVVPTDVDVLCGSGSTKAMHPGNQRFRRIVATHYAAYASAQSKTEKMKVSRQIMKEVVSVGGRFLKKRTGAHDWYVADIKVGKDKTSHCLRDIKNKKNRNIWADYHPDAPPDVQGESLTTAHRSGQTLYEAHEPLQRERNLAFTPSALPLPGTMVDIQPRPSGRHHEYKRAAQATGISPSMLDTSPAPIPGSYSAARRWGEVQPASPAQNQLLVEFANSFGRKEGNRNIKDSPTDEGVARLPRRSPLPEAVDALWTRQQRYTDTDRSSFAQPSRRHPAYEHEGYQSAWHHQISGQHATGYQPRPLPSFESYDGSSWTNNPPGADPEDILPNSHANTSSPPQRGQDSQRHHSRKSTSDRRDAR